jgi:hypothetical protein
VVHHKCHDTGTPIDCRVRDHGKPADHFVFNDLIKRPAGGMPPLPLQHPEIVALQGHGALLRSGPAFVSKIHGSPIITNGMGKGQSFSPYDQDHLGSFLCVDLPPWGYHVLTRWIPIG